MSATYTATRPAAVGSLLGHGVLATAIACAATPLVAAAGTGVGISLDVGRRADPGARLRHADRVLLADRRGAGRGHVPRAPAAPDSTFLRTTVVLTALSLVPDLIAPAAPATKALLMLTHLVAAAIVIPAVARRSSSS